MPVRIKGVPAGRLVWVDHQSACLQHNRWSDPAVRQFPVWLPEGYDGADITQRYPVFYGLAGYLGSGPSLINWQPFNENIPERVARLIQEGRMGPVILVFPDCFTRLGGNQYIDSSALGCYGRYLNEELVPFIDAQFRTLASPAHRGLFGKSSGGYGALMQGVNSQTWGGVVSHAGDAGFELVYRPEWPNTLDALAPFAPPRDSVDSVMLHQRLQEGYDDGRVAAFLTHLFGQERPSSAHTHALMNLGMAATYDPDPEAPNGFRLPCHLQTGEWLPERWQRWLDHDPIHALARHETALRRLRLLYLDCGWRDQYHLHYGSRQLSAMLTRHNIPHEFEEFDGTHSGIDFRLDHSLPKLYAALRPGT